LRQRFPEDKLEILVPKSNAGSFTYDGIELGGERVANEVEARLEELKKDGHDIKKFSITGYSLGGLVARYAIGLLSWTLHIGVIMADSRTELHHICYAASRCTDAGQRIPQPSVERSGSQDALYQRQATVRDGQL
jgi:hypothetical protein